MDSLVVRVCEVWVCAEWKHGGVQVWWAVRMVLTYQ